MKELIKNLVDTYKVPETNILCIADNSDQSISAEIQRNKVRIQNAYKVDRIQQIFDLREALKRKDVLLNEKYYILKYELDNYICSWYDNNKCVIYETDDEYYHPDGLAALRYAFYYLVHKK